jgi:thiamine transport system permease protein
MVSPYLLLLSDLSFRLQLNTVDFFWALQNTIGQAVGSGLLTLLMGIPGGLGLLWLQRKLSNRSYGIFEKFLMLPNILPSLFVVVACLGLLDPFPYGKSGIILIHTVMNVGLISVLFAALCRQKLENLGALALVEGASRWQFFRTGVLGYLGPDLFYLFLFVFSMALVSLNVPLLVGGSTGTTLEVLIFENLVIENNWSEALNLSFIQMLLLAVVSLLNRPMEEAHLARDRAALLRMVEAPWGLVFPVVALLMVLGPPLWSLPNGFRQLTALNFDFMQLLGPSFFSLALAMATGGFLVLLMMGACLGYQLPRWRRFVLAYLTPGSILMGFAFFILRRWLTISIAVEVVIGLGLVFFPALLRLSLGATLQSLRGQMEVAQVLGASPFLIFQKVVAPQVMKPIATLGGIGSMWACGDFALSKVLSAEDFHLALIVKGLASHYRLDAAQTLMFGLYLLALICFLFWWRLGDVLSRKFNR